MTKKPVQTSNTQWRVALESEIPGKLPTSPVYKNLAWESSPTYGPKTNTKERGGISGKRQKLKPDLVSITNDVSFNTRFTSDTVEHFAPYFLTRKFYKGGILPISSVTVENGYMVDRTLLTGPVTTNYYYRAFDFSNPSNNREFRVTQLSLTTGTASRRNPTNVGIMTTNTETDTSGKLYFTGLGFESGELSIKAAESKLLCTSTSFDFTTVPLTEGQAIIVGGDTSSNSFEKARFTARILKIEAKSLTLDNIIGFDQNNQGISSLQHDEDGAGKAIRLYTGPFLSNGWASDTDGYIERTLSFEAVLPGLDNAEDTSENIGYLYSDACFPNELKLSLKTEDVSLADMSFVGLTDPSEITYSERQASRPNNSVDPLSYKAGDLGFVQVYGSDDLLSSFIYSTDITISNNIQRERYLGSYVTDGHSIGDIMVSVSFEAAFTSKTVFDAAIKSKKAGLSLFLVTVAKDDGIIIDIPSILLNIDNLNFNPGETVKLNTTATSFEDDIFHKSITFTVFKSLPEWSAIGMIT